jgi:hypothetical protein
VLDLSAKRTRIKRRVDQNSSGRLEADYNLRVPIYEFHFAVSTHQAPGDKGSDHGVCGDPISAANIRSS